MGRLRESAFVLISVLGIAVAVGLALSTLAFVSVASLRSLNDETQRLKAFYAADAGIERTHALLRQYLKTQTSTDPATLTTNALLYLEQNALPGYDITGAVQDANFYVTLSPDASDPAAILVRSLGKTPAGATRAIESRLRVSYRRYSVNALAALTSSGGAIDSGNAPIKGRPYKLVTGSTFDFTCTHDAFQCPSDGSPRRYTVTRTAFAGHEPVLGDVYTRIITNDDDTQDTSTRYSVSNISADGLTIELTAINEHVPTTTTDTSGNKKADTTYTDTPLSVQETSPHTGQLTLVDGVPAAATGYNSDGTVKNGNNTQVTCTDPNGGCITHDIAMSELFQSVFGMTKDEMRSALPTTAFTSTDTCNPVGWVTTLQSNVSLASCPDARVTIIDATQLPSTNGQVQISTDTPFFGLVYVISDGRPVTFSGNSTYTGSIYVEGPTGSKTAVSVSGTSANLCGYEGEYTDDPEPVEEHDPKICYSDKALTAVSDILKGYAPATGPQANAVTGSWKEASGAY